MNTQKTPTLTKSVLVLDDEDDIVNIFRISLEQGGFSVFGFTDPLLALEHFGNNLDKYGLVLTDVRMPQMSGFEFAANIRRLSPRVTILIMSAFDMKDLNPDPSLQIEELLQKPLSVIKLLGAVSKYATLNGLTSNRI